MLNQHRIEATWEESGAWPVFVQAMRRTFLENTAPQAALRLTHLPGLCCQAAGGQPEWADPFAQAWFLFYSAAHLMDSVEDQDEPDAWWQAAGPGAAINAASGLYFSGSLLLNELYAHEVTRPAAPQVTLDFYRTLLVMSSGQHQDLLNPAPTLEQYWQIAEAKSGEFFALACRGGARLAVEQPAMLHGFSQFGKCLGVMLQALDDLSDVQPDPSGSLPDLGPKSLRCLPVVYALTVLPAAPRSQLQAALRQSQEDQAAKQNAYQLIDSSGAALYLLSKLHSLRSLALTGLERAGLHQTAIDGLADFLPEG